MNPIALIITRTVLCLVFLLAMAFTDGSVSFICGVGAVVLLLRLIDDDEQ